MTAEVRLEILRSCPDRVEVRVLGGGAPGCPACSCGASAEQGERLWLPRAVFAGAELQPGQQLALSPCGGSVARHAWRAWGLPWAGLVLGGIVGTLGAAPLQLPPDAAGGLLALLGAWAGARQAGRKAGAGWALRLHRP
ncbi:MAG: hypothetical protein KatS3mg126_1904 [Lysobacteraceae bacterium]|nr:MAG: hypothetical protein KatS3mg126_1904 [Xanthomonadaceae bacterium]